MIDIDVARRLRDAGLVWTPADGDRFAIDVEQMEEETFMLASMVIERARGRLGGVVFRFNGTTEWALDSVSQEEAVWLPREEQLRDALADDFLCLQRLEDGRFMVTVRAADGTERQVRAPQAEDALAGALLILLSDG